MRVEMKIQVQGLRDGERWPGIGETIELPDDEAELLIAQGYAVPAKTKAKKAEEATAKKAKKATATPRGEKR